MASASSNRTSGSIVGSYTGVVSSSSIARASYVEAASGADVPALAARVIESAASLPPSQHSLASELTKLKRVVIITAPFEVDRTGDMAYVHMLEKTLKIQGIEVSYLRAADDPSISGLVPVSLNTGPEVSLEETFSALSTIGMTLVDRIIREYDPNEVVINLHLRVPHTGFAFGKDQLQVLKDKGFKICLTIHEFRLNEGPPSDSERRFQTLELFSQGLFDQLHLFSRREFEEFTKSCFFGLTDFEREVEKAPREIQSSPAWIAAPSVYESTFLPSKKGAAKGLEDFFSTHATVLNIPDLIRPSFPYGLDNLAERRPDIMLLGMIRLNKGEDVAIELARGLRERGLPNRVVIVGRVPAIPFGLDAIVKLLEACYGDAYIPYMDGLSAALIPILEESVEDHTVRFNALVRSIIKELGEPNLPMDFHIDLSDEEVVRVSESCKFGVRYDWKGMADNASAIINMMGGGLVVFANRGFLTDEATYKIGSDAESPLVMLDEESHIEPPVSFILSKLQEYNDRPDILLSKQSVLKSLMETKYSQDFVGPAFARMFRSLL